MIDLKHPSWKKWLSEIANDLMLLSTLHGSELTEARVGQMAEIGFFENLMLGLLSIESQEIARKLVGFLNQLAAFSHDEANSYLEDLASEYAAIYLNGFYEVSPHSSPWLDQDGLMCQEPMFQVQTFYQKYNVQKAIGLMLSPDHLSIELQFVSHLLEQSMQKSDQDSIILKDVCDFMDQFILNWLEDFAAIIAKRCKEFFYPELALITASYLKELRQYLAEALDYPISKRVRAKSLSEHGVGESRQEPSQAFVPGLEPGL